MTSVTIRSFTPEAVQSKAARKISELLLPILEKNKTLVLLSGGSAIKMYVELFNILLPRLTHPDHLVVSLFDERFVPKGSPDSNEQQLADAGVLQALQNAGIPWIPYLEKDMTPGKEQAANIQLKFVKFFQEHTHCIALAGLGDDGHTAGLLPTKDPGTIQSVFHSPNFVEYYQLPKDAANSFRERITCTPHLMTKLEKVVVYANGAKKRVALENLVTGKLSISECPAVALRNSRSSVVVLTDQKVEE